MTVTTAQGVDGNLQPVVAALAKKFNLVEGFLLLSEVDLRAAAKDMRAVPENSREAVLLDLIVLAVRFRAESEEATMGAVAQLLALAEALMDGHLDAVLKAFESAGLNTAAALSAVGAQTSKTPVTGNAAGPNSLFSAMLKSKK